MSSAPQVPGVDVRGERRDGDERRDAEAFLQGCDDEVRLFGQLASADDVVAPPTGPRAGRVATA